MSRLAPALRIRRREVDGVRLAIAAERQRAAMVASEVSQLAERRTAERTLLGPVPADAWFAAAERRLAALAQEGAESEVRLADLRRAAINARARLTLLEQAEAAAIRAERRKRDRDEQSALDDRTAADWVRR